jgi:hypothetical protein
MFCIFFIYNLYFFLIFESFFYYLVRVFLRIGSQIMIKWRYQDYIPTIYTPYVPNSFKVTYHIPKPVSLTEENCKPDDYGLNNCPKLEWCWRTNITIIEWLNSTLTTTQESR